MGDTSIDYFQNIVEITYKITDYCNLDCPFCSNNRITGNTKQVQDEVCEMDTNFILFCRHFKHKNLKLKITGGEPFAVKKRMLHVVEQVKADNRNVHISVDTNFLYFKSEDIDKFKDVSELRISVKDPKDYLTDRHLSVMNLCHAHGIKVHLVFVLTNHTNIKNYFKVFLKYLSVLKANAFYSIRPELSFGINNSILNLNTSGMFKYLSFVGLCKKLFADRNIDSSRGMVWNFVLKTFTTLDDKLASFSSDESVRKPSTINYEECVANIRVHSDGYIYPSHLVMFGNRFLRKVLHISNLDNFNFHIRELSIQSEFWKMYYKWKAFYV